MKSARIDFPEIMNKSGALIFGFWKVLTDHLVLLKMYLKGP